MPLERQVLIARQMAAALSYMHATDIVHNDLKSLNVLVRSWSTFIWFMSMSYLFYLYCVIGTLSIYSRSLIALSLFQVDEYFRVKLCDFGLARSVTAIAQQREAPAGTPNYVAPVRFWFWVSNSSDRIPHCLGSHIWPVWLIQELWSRQSPSKATDVYSLGVILCELFTRDVPVSDLLIHVNPSFVSKSIWSFCVSSTA